MHVTEEDQRSVYPYTVTGSATLADPEDAKRRTRMLQTTYLYLAVAVFGCMGGAWLGAHWKSFLMLFFAGRGLVGFFATLFILNLVPALALSVAEKSPRYAVPALGLNGFVAGLVISPLVFLGLLSKTGENGGDLVSTAVVVTGAIFASITAYVHINKAKFAASNAIMWGLMGFSVVCVPVSMFLHSSLLSLVIALAIGMLGAYQLAVGTSAIVNNPNFDSPARGALILFAGVFNTFQAVLALLLSGGRN